MLRDKETVALNDVLVQCETNARHFRYTAELVEEQSAITLFQQLADERAHAAAKLRQEMMRQGELADTADVETNTLQELGETFASGFGAWGFDDLLQARMKDEEKLTQRISEALALSIPDAYRPLLRQIEERLLADMQRLRESHAPK